MYDFQLLTISATLYHMQWTAEGCFLVPSVWVFLFVYEISLKVPDGFASNSHGRHVWSLTRKCLKVKVTRDKNGIFRPFWRSACGLCLVEHLWCYRQSRQSRHFTTQPQVTCASTVPGKMAKMHKSHFHSVGLCYTHSAPVCCIPERKSCHLWCVW